jgi:hypothetical protein
VGNLRAEDGQKKVKPGPKGERFAMVGVEESQTAVACRFETESDMHRALQQRF